MKKLISVVAAVLAICLAGLSYYSSEHAMSTKLGIAGSALNGSSSTLPETVTDAVTETTTQLTTAATTVTTTKATTKATIKATTKSTTRKVITTVVKTTLSSLKDTGETSTKKSSYVEKLNYGVTASVTEYKYYKIMSDGTSVYDKTTKNYVYDRSNYSATTDELKPEAYRNMDKYASERSEVLDIINGYRNDLDKADLTVSKTLSQAANVRAVEIAWSDQCNHTRPDGRRCFTLFEEFGITSGKAGENIGWGYNTPKAICKGWYDSYSHYKNISDSNFTKTGIGVAKGPDGKMYWVQLFSS